jgi:hypothetical protein
LRAVPIGDGSIHRIVRELQSEFFSPPVLDRNHVPRWSSRRRNGVRASAES